MALFRRPATGWEPVPPVAADPCAVGASPTHKPWVRGSLGSSAWKPWAPSRRPVGVRDDGTRSPSLPQRRMVRRWRRHGPGGSGAGGKTKRRSLSRSTPAGGAEGSHRARGARCSAGGTAGRVAVRLCAENKRNYKDNDNKQKKKILKFNLKPNPFDRLLGCCGHLARTYSTDGICYFFVSDI